MAGICRGEGEISMLYLNIRMTQPMIGIHTQLGQLEAHSTPARLSTENRQARSNAGATQVTIDIDSYPSRHSYGYTNHADFAKQYGQQGFSDLKSTTSGHTQKAWQIIDGAAKKNANMMQNLAKGEISNFISKGKNRHIVTELIPDPTITVHPAELKGTPDPGDVTVNIDTDAFAQTHFTPGQVQTYMQQEANVRQWVTEDHYDTYA